MGFAFWKKPAPTWRRGERPIVPEATEKRIKAALQGFREHLKIDRGFTDDTTHGYGNHLGAVLRRVGTAKPSLNQMKDYLLWMRDAGFSFSAQHNSILALEAYSSMRGAEVHFGRQPKPKRVLKGLLTEAEVSRIIQAAGTPRLRAMIAVLAYSGVRCGEFVRIKVEDYDVGANRLRVTLGKNAKDRYVSVPAECTRLVVDYLRTNTLADGDWLFTTLVRGARLASADIRKILHVLSAKAKIGRRVPPHLL